MTSKALRVILIGCGRMGQLHAQAVACGPDARLEAVCDIHLPLAQELATRYRSKCSSDAHGLIADLRPDVVIVATPDHLHCELALLAFRAQANVFCEKPLAETVDEAQRMVAAAADAGVSLAVNYNRRYGFAYEEARTILDRGMIGEIQAISIHVVDGVPPAPVARTADVILTTLLTHHFDLARFLAGEIRTVTCKFSPVQAGIHRDVVILLELASGALATIHASYREGQTRTVESATIVGSRGSIHAEDVTREVRWNLTDADEIHILRPNSFTDADRLGFWSTSQRHLHDFFGRLQRNQMPAITGTDGLIGMRIAEAARLSYQQTQTVSLTM